MPAAPSRRRLPNAVTSEASTAKARASGQATGGFAARIDAALAAMSA
jgi:hypothetical protein